MALNGILYLKNGKGFHRIVKHSGITLGLVFIGGFPLGFLLAYQVFGTPWTGVPFGWDITDNKTLLIFIFWGTLLFLIRGTIVKSFRSGRGKFCPFRLLLGLIWPPLKKGGRPLKDTISRRKFARLAVIGSIFSLSLYLIPHSLLVSPLVSIVLFGLMVSIFILPLPEKDIRRAGRPTRG